MYNQVLLYLDIYNKSENFYFYVKKSFFHLSIEFPNFSKAIQKTYKNEFLTSCSLIKDKPKKELRKKKSPSKSQEIYNV